MPYRFRSSLLKTALSAALVLSVATSLGHAATAPLVLAGHTDLPGYTGDFDHFGVDLDGNRLFLAAEDHGTLEKFNLQTGAHEQTITGTQTPHSIFFVPSKNRLIVTDSGSEGTKIFDATKLTVVGTLKLTPGADSIGYDAPAGHLYIVTGGKDVDMKECFLEEIDPVSLHQLGKLRFDSNHTEAMAVEQNSGQIFINVTDKNYLAVVDKTKLAVTKTWHIGQARQNAPIAMDEATHRLFVVTRQPGMLIVLNADTGETVASFKAPLRTDEVVFDKANKRVYVLGGEGYIGVFQENDPDHIVHIADVPSAPGAKTGVLVPSLHRLYVAASPGDTKATGGIMWFDVRP